MPNNPHMQWVTAELYSVVHLLIVNMNNLKIIRLGADYE